MDIIAKTRQDYNQIARHFAATRFRLWPEIEQFRPWLKSGQRLLDWGCGSGRLRQLMGRKKIDYVGVDISEALLKIARQRQRLHPGRGQARFYCTARRPKIFPADYFDWAFLVASFHHLPDVASRRQVLQQIFRSLKPGGRCIITVWNFATPWARARYRQWKKIGRRDFLVPWKNPQGQVVVERYYHFFTRAELRNLLREAGFVAEPFAPYNRVPWWADSQGAQNLVAVARKPD